MARKTAKFPLLVLRLSFEGPKNREGYCHIKGWIDRTDERMLYPSEKSVGGAFCGVRITSQTDFDRLSEGLVGGGFYPMYAVGLEWDRNSGHGLTELKYGVVALSEIDRKMDKATAEFGPPASFGAWVQRVCGAIGLDKVKMPHHNYDQSPSDAAWRIDSLIRDWVKTARVARGLEAA